MTTENEAQNPKQPPLSPLSVVEQSLPDTPLSLDEINELVHTVRRQQHYETRSENQPLQELLQLEDVQFAQALYSYLVDKRTTHQSLDEVENVAYLLLTMLLDIEMEGFVDLFYQLYSLEETRVVERYLRYFELNKLAALFAEAKQLYIDGKADITEEEYQAIDPFGDDERWGRFDQIGKEILAADSEIYLLPERVYTWVKSHARAVQVHQHEP